VRPRNALDLYPGSPLFSSTLGASNSSVAHSEIVAARSFFLRSASSSLVVTGRTAWDAIRPPTTTAARAWLASCGQAPPGPAENTASLSGLTMSRS